MPIVIEEKLIFIKFMILIFRNFYVALSDKDLIRSALRRWEENTCIEFKEIDNTNTEAHYLKFAKGQGLANHLVNLNLS
jgi:hypothetical protein